MVLGVVDAWLPRERQLIAERLGGPPLHFSGTWLPRTCSLAAKQLVGEVGIISSFTKPAGVVELPPVLGVSNVRASHSHIDLERASRARSLACRRAGSSMPSEDAKAEASIVFWESVVSKDLGAHST